MVHIDALHTNFPYFGSRKILVKLKDAGYTVCRKTVRKLMQEMAYMQYIPKKIYQNVTSRKLLYLTC